MSNNNRTAYTTTTGQAPVSRLAALADLSEDKPAKNIRRPQVAKQSFSRTARQARLQDGVSNAVTVRYATKAV